MTISHTLDTMMTTTVITIPRFGLEAARNKIAKMNKRARKLDLSPIDMKIGETSYRKVYDSASAHSWTVEFVELIIEGEEIKLGGWTLMGVLDLRYNEPIVYFSREDFDSAEWVAVNGGDDNCDHCNTNRRRVDVYVLRGEDGGLIQVGKSCLQDFVGHGNPVACAALAGELANLRRDLEMDDEEISERGSAHYRISVSEILQLTSASVRRYGWVSTSRANEQGRVSTADDVRGTLWGSASKDDVLTVDAEDRETAQKIIDLWNEKSVAEWRGEGDWHANVAVLMGEEAILPKSLAILASGIVALLQSEEREAKKMEKEISDAPSGKRIVTGTISMVRAQDGDYGVQYKMRVAADEGYGVWSTIPKNVRDTVDRIKDLTGRRITFTATLKPSNNDKTFAFASRPSKATLLEEGQE